jgi:hypothetical protein
MDFQSNPGPNTIIGADDSLTGILGLKCA